ncbi:hypothetical protein FOA52_016154 [Chlamydomonas sp. UWO 241]|nr:hypothetical protein FOA52_016154 [Chlamydomonas sp. UWO 241]
MTVDRAQRKGAKRKWQQHAKDKAKERGEEGFSEGAPKRIRKKTNVKRRMCRGLCYSDPALALTEKDRTGVWDGGEGEEAADAGYDSDVDAAQRSASSQGATSSGAVAAAVVGSELGAKAGVKLSTEVQLPASLHGAAANAPKMQKKQKKLPGGDGGVAAAKQPRPEPGPALAPYHSLVRNYMASQGHTEPTPIQECCWPSACAGGDVQGVAQPGSGKTLAYLLPAFARVQDAGHDGASNPEGPLVLVIVPTRELAIQVAQQARALRAVSGLRTAVVYGGVPKEGQALLLAKRPHALVATPGRLLDLMDDGVLSLAQVSCVVLDEADKMLSLGFEAQLKRLHATLLPAAVRLAGKIGHEFPVSSGVQQGNNLPVLLAACTNAEDKRKMLQLVVMADAMIHGRPMMEYESEREMFKMPQNLKILPKAVISEGHWTQKSGWPMLAALAGCVTKKEFSQLHLANFFSLSCDEATTKDKRQFLSVPMRMASLQ